MTVSNQTARTSATGTGTGGQEVSFSFPISDTSDLTVIKRVTATGVETTLVETTNYTVSIDGDSGGTLTTVTAIETSEEIHIIRNTPMTQALDLEQGGSFSAESIEDALDKNTKLIIENADTINRTITFPQTDDEDLNTELPNSVDRASTWLYFDADGAVTTASSVTPSTATVSTFGETLIDDNNAAAALTTLGITSFAQTILDDANEATFKATVNLETGTDVQAWDDDLDDLAALTPTDGNFIVGDGTDWVAESGVTARTSLGTFAVADVVCYENETVCYENETITWRT